MLTYKPFGEPTTSKMRKGSSKYKNNGKKVIVNENSKSTLGIQMKKPTLVQLGT
jgi:hypothetical protein